MEKEKILLYGVVLNKRGGTVIGEEYMNEIVYLKRNLDLDLRTIE